MSTDCFARGNIQLTVRIRWKLLMSFACGSFSMPACTWHAGGRRHTAHVCLRGRGIHTAASKHQLHWESQPQTASPLHTVRPDQDRQPAQVVRGHLPATSQQARQVQCSSVAYCMHSIQAWKTQHRCCGGSLLCRQRGSQFGHPLQLHMCHLNRPAKAANVCAQREEQTHIHAGQRVACVLRA